MFSIRVFLEKNYPYFTIIGVIGTMLVLLPNLAERIAGKSWFQSDFVAMPISLSIVLIFGDLLISGIFLILLLKIWEGRKFESFIFNNWLKEGDPHRLLLSSCLLPLMFGLIYFIGMTAFLLPNPYATITSFILVTIIALIFLGYIFSKIFASRIWLIITVIIILILLCLSLVPNPIVHSYFNY